MLQPSHLTYRFGDFEFDPARLALYHCGNLVKVEKKALEVLAELIRNPNRLTSSDEIIEAVWGENMHGVTSVHLAQSLSKLRKALAAYDSDHQYIENQKGKGYIFTADVETVAHGPETNDLPVTGKTPIPSDGENGIGKVLTNRWSYTQIAAAVLLLFVGLFAVLAWYWFPADEEEEIKRVVEQSQKYESMVLYRDPENIDEAKLAEYWLPEAEFGDEVDIKRIRAGVGRLRNEGKRYGPETKCEQFEFQFVEINKQLDFATVKTLERWFIAEYLSDGTLFKNKTVGPYFVHYIVRKVDGRWRIERSTTARVTPPPPSLDNIEALSAVVAGQQLFVRITGTNFIPDSVAIKVTGPGCPETTPCIVPNRALRLHSELTESIISNVPLTLSSGEFEIAVQNADSPPSNAVTLVVP